MTKKFRVLEAPEGVGTVAEKVRHTLSPAVVIEYLPIGMTQPVMKVLGMNIGEVLGRLQNAGFETMYPPYTSASHKPRMGEFG